MDELDLRVRTEIYSSFVRTGNAPAAADVADALELALDEVAAACAEHFAGRMLPLYPHLTMRVRKQGDIEFLPRDMRVRDTGWSQLTTIQVVYETPQSSTTH